MGNRTDIFVPVAGGLQQRQGYINPATNQTFLDSNFQQRVPVGSVVNTNDGQFIMTANGGVRHSPQTPLRPASQMDTFMGHAGNMRGLSNTALNSAIRQNNSATEQAIRDYQNMAHAVNQSAEEQARAAYIQRLRSKNTLPRLLRAQGITGGAAESTAARMSSNFDNLQFGIMRGRENALLDLEHRQTAARERGRQNEAGIRQQHATQRMQMEDNLHNRQLQAAQMDQTALDRRRNEMIAVLPQFGNDFQAQINYLNVHGDPYNLIPHLQMLRNEKIHGIEAEEQAQMNAWIMNVSNFPSSVIYSTIQERLSSLDYLQISALRSAYYAAVERERQIGISQAGEMRAQEAHESNMSTADLNRATLELNRMITELMLPLTLDGQRASNAANWGLARQRNR